MKRKIEETLGFNYISFLFTPCNLQSKYHLVQKSLAKSFSVIERVTQNTTEINCEVLYYHLHYLNNNSQKGKI